MTTHPDSEPIKLSCPTCKKAVLWSPEFPFRPFCCERCQLIDLGAWANEEHAIAGQPLGMPPEQQDQDTAD